MRVRRAQKQHLVLFRQVVEEQLQERRTVWEFESQEVSPQQMRGEVPYSDRV